MIAYDKIRELLPEEQGGAFISSLQKGDAWKMGSKSYSVVYITEKGIRIKEVDSIEKSKILTVKRYPRGYYGNFQVEHFFRTLESELTLDLINENNSYHYAGFVTKKVSEFLSKNLTAVGV